MRIFFITLTLCLFAASVSAQYGTDLSYYNQNGQVPSEPKWRISHMPFHWYDMKHVQDEATLKSKDEELFNNLDNFELMYELHTNVRLGGEYKSFELEGEKNPITHKLKTTEYLIKAGWVFTGDPQGIYNINLKYSHIFGNAKYSFYNANEKRYSVESSSIQYDTNGIEVSFGINGPVFIEIGYEYYGIFVNRDYITIKFINGYQHIGKNQGVNFRLGFKL